MSYEPIVGHDHAKPVIDYAGTEPVCMVSPCPYSQWDFVKVELDAAITAGNGFAQATATSGAGISGSQVAFSMLSTGAGTLNFSVTSSASGVIGSAVIRTYVGSETAGGPLTVSTGGTSSGTLAVPYYRYKISIDFSIAGTWGSGDWVKVDISMS